MSVYISSVPTVSYDRCDLRKSMISSSVLLIFWTTKKEQSSFFLNGAELSVKYSEFRESVKSLKHELGLI